MTEIVEMTMVGVAFWISQSFLKSFADTVCMQTKARVNLEREPAKFSSNSLRVYESQRERMRATGGEQRARV